MKPVGWKKRLKHELVEEVAILVFLAPFLISFAIFREHLLGQCGRQDFSYGEALWTALLNALVLSKVISLGEIAKIGRSSEHKPLIQPIIHKAAMFTVVDLIFHLLEVVIGSLFHGKTLDAALRSIEPAGEFLALSLVVFFGFIPFFALRETRRALGLNEFRRLFMGLDPELKTQE